VLEAVDLALGGIVRLDDGIGGGPGLVELGLGGGRARRVEHHQTGGEDQAEQGPQRRAARPAPAHEGTAPVVTGSQRYQNSRPAPVGPAGKSAARAGGPVGGRAAGYAPAMAELTGVDVLLDVL